jgi:hypothetical protein
VIPTWVFGIFPNRVILIYKQADKILLSFFFIFGIRIALPQGLDTKAQPLTSAEKKKARERKYVDLRRREFTVA